MFTPGEKVIAMYKFEKQFPQAISFTKDDIMTVLSTCPDPNWIKVQNSKGEQGMVPSSYFKKTDKFIGPWFHDDISRVDTERLLSKHTNGTFIIRSSMKFPGDYTLSVRFNVGVEHYRIYASDNQSNFYVDEETVFTSLQALIAHYKMIPDGLCCCLEDFIPNAYQVQLQALDVGGWVINMQEITLKEKIGSGEFGDVMKGIYQGNDVAVKCFKKDKSSTEMKMFTYEASFMTSLCHKNLVTFIGFSYDKTQVYLVTEFMTLGSLVNYLRTRGRSLVSASDQIAFATDTCRGMSYLESKEFIHRDLAARNVLLSKDMVAKVADFGMAKTNEGLDKVDTHQTSTPNTSSAGKLPVKWTAPESVKFNQFSNKSDVWSFGVLLWEIYSFGRMPYPKLLASAVINSIENGLRMECPDGCPPEIYSIMLSCWQIQPADRPTFASLLRRFVQMQSSEPPSTLV